MLILAFALLLRVSPPLRRLQRRTTSTAPRCSRRLPGKLLEVVDFYKAGWPGMKETGDEPPIAMRHSQGDRWDLLLLFPMGSVEQYYSPERVRSPREGVGGRARRDRDDSPGTSPGRRTSSFSDRRWRRSASSSAPAGFFHVEMFESLPGRQRDLYREREMENAYSTAIGQPENLIFMRESGAHWDLFTVGAFRDLKHYASSADVPEAKQDEAAHAAGFDSRRRSDRTCARSSPSTTTPWRCAVK